MSSKRVLDFASYHRLNEEEESKSISAVDQLIDLFFQAYGSLVTKIGDYKEAGKDLTGVAKADDKGKAMVDAINKIAQKVDPKYTEAATAMVVAAKKIKDGYEALLKTPDGQKELENIKDKVYDKIISYLETLAKSSKEAPKVEAPEKKEESENYSEELGHNYLFEKNTFVDERNELVKKITPLYSQVVYLGKNSTIASVKSECTKMAKELKSYYDLLNNEGEWASMKRKERKDKLEEILNKINEVPPKLNEVTTQALVKIGIDGKVQEIIKSATELIAKALETLNKQEEEQIQQTDDEKEDDKKEDDKKEDDVKYEEIKSGNVEKSNISKDPAKNKNMEKIKQYQEKMNEILPTNSKGEKMSIKADGQYGNDTEKAIIKISNLFGDVVPEIKGLDGKSMTPDFIKFINKYDKDKISKMFAEMFK